MTLDLEINLADAYKWYEDCFGWSMPDTELLPYPDEIER